MQRSDKEPYKEPYKEIANLLVEIQHGQTAPIEISIGYVNDQNIVMDGVVIKKAPPRAIKELISRGYDLDVTKEGVRVSKI